MGYGKSWNNTTSCWFTSLGYLARHFCRNENSDVYEKGSDRDHDTVFKGMAWICTEKQTSTLSLASDTGGEMRVNSLRAAIAVWPNTSQRSRVGVRVIGV